MVLKALGGDVRVTMYRQKPRIVCKSRDGGVFRRGQIGAETENIKRIFREIHFEGFEKDLFLLMSNTQRNF